MSLALELRNFKAIGEENKILSSASLSLNTGEKLCIYGPSGSGKSILLSFINGFMISSLKYSYDSFNDSQLPKTYFNYNQNIETKEFKPLVGGLTLIDEPENHFSIDALKGKLEEMNNPVSLIFVTHHLDYVENLSDKVLVLHYGAFKGVYDTNDFFSSKDPYISYIATMGC
ncbi:MAG: hypothetical protein CMB80_32875 [Flammeovirgaceae bacterium]|nr:hypothetical protein [Flammeovirgaceae bacterium]MBE62164.1 hypothetical protein [Flammeovirgaceae bacterium]MBR10614.1 hypothetical protein [Rickettsiales bacterium]HCX21173.1 hypothetical protein [Cytophagales bacterium]|tara:strand:- start:5600 stop:6115 length:516 start_codon:yes stop_codon:yes gene_type:complete